MFTWENNFGGEESSPANVFKVDSVGLTLYKSSDSSVNQPMGFLPTGSFSNFQEVKNTDEKVDSRLNFFKSQNIDTLVSLYNHFVGKSWRSVELKLVDEAITFVINDEAKLDLAGAWDEGFASGRHTSESNKNPYKG